QFRRPPRGCGDAGGLPRGAPVGRRLKMAKPPATRSPAASPVESDLTRMARSLAQFRGWSVPLQSVIGASRGDSKSLPEQDAPTTVWSGTLQPRFSKSALFMLHSALRLLHLHPLPGPGRLEHGVADM